MFERRILPATLVIALAAAGAAHAQTTVTLPSTQTTTLTATVTEQARVTVPANVTFNVTNVAAATTADVPVTVDNIVLATATKQLKISIQAAAAAFTPPVNGATTWSAGDVSWNAATWTNATGVAGLSLSNTAYQEVATCAADAATCSTTGLVFTLGAKSAVKRSGNHTLNVTWKFESI